MDRYPLSAPPSGCVSEGAAPAGIAPCTPTLLFQAPRLRTEGIRLLAFRFHSVFLFSGLVTTETSWQRRLIAAVLVSSGTLYILSAF